MLGLSLFLLATLADDAKPAAVHDGGFAQVCPG